MAAGSPFVGLRSFEADEASWFFGRERETSALLAKLQSARFTAVVGASGSGKSSLVRAGVVPLLREQGWQEIITKPGSAPITRLARSLASGGADSGLAAARHFSFDTALRSSAFGLAEIVESPGIDAAKLLLVVDQFEELFRFGDDASGAMKAGMREESRAFIELLLTGAAAGNGRLHVCVTMRSDFFGACSSYAGLAEAVSASQFLVPIPTRSQLDQVVRAPVKKADARIQENLVQRLLVDVEEEQDKLPLLQHTLRRLWERASGNPRTLGEQDYVAIGKIAGSIDRKAEAIRDELEKSNPIDLITLERVMTALTELDVRGRATRRMQKRSELLALLEGSEFPDATALARSLDRVLALLKDEAISFVQVGEGEDPDVDIGHEALIRHWTRLSGPQCDFQSGWLHEEREYGDLWRGYRRRAEGGALLSGGELRKLRRRPFREKWSARYGDRWRDVNAFITKSRWYAIGRWAAVGLVCLVVGGVAWESKEFVRWQIHKYLDIGPFMKTEVKPYVLKTADEAALKPFSTFRECADEAKCPEMVVIPPGEFVMGSEDGKENERPPHRVEIRKRFAAGKYELTHEQWTTCVEKGWCRPAFDSFLGRGRRPVNNISWQEAQQYVDWLSQMTGKEYRLLSEAEWEYAARAGTTTPFYWDDGQDIGKGNANCAQCGNDFDDQETLPVGRFPPNKFGLYDTRGNVWELVADPAHENYAGAPADGSVWIDAQAPPGALRIARGGGWQSNVSNLRASYRFSVSPGDRFPSVGVRVARTLSDAK